MATGDGIDDLWLTCSLGRWMIQQRAVLAAMERGGSLDWGLVARDTRLAGVTDCLEQAPTKETCEETWHRMKRSPGITLRV